MKSVDTPQSRCRVALARADITPPIGIYHRFWGAAAHDRATDVHRPLSVTAIWLEPLGVPEPAAHLILAIDHCIVDFQETARVSAAISQATSLRPQQVRVCPSHTHGAGNLSRSRVEQPGGELISPYLDEMTERCVQLAVTVASQARPATIVYGQGHCALAAQRDYWDEELQRYVCGYNPLGAADDTVVVARMTDDDGTLLGTLVNYACHPTTLGWQSTAISPDFVGAMREMVEGHTAAPCVFLQGASGDLGPREGFVGDWQVADRNGRQLGFAALAALEALPPAGTRFVYSGATLSGTEIGTWSRQPLEPESLARQQSWHSRRVVVPLACRRDLPDLEETRRQRAAYETQEREAASRRDTECQRTARAQVEQKTRIIARLESLTDRQQVEYEVLLLHAGGALWVFVGGEPYQTLQTTLRRRFPQLAIIVTTLVNDWRPTYLPAAASYGQGIYQEMITVVEAGSLELLIDSLISEISQLLADSPDGSRLLQFQPSHLDGKQPSPPVGPRESIARPKSESTGLRARPTIRR